MTDSLLITDGAPEAVFNADEWQLPEHWTPAARDAVHNVLKARPDLDGGDVGALEQAGELISLADGLADVARAAGLVSTGSTGQVTVHPAVTEARLARTAAAAILAKLNPANAAAAQARRAANLVRGPQRGDR
ncbi:MULTISPECIES: hypothetical protein [Curtobacterium]|uniref:hypothetical protein n=1 Tax=Curtobacterium TaxID=2034 RepID=UPI0011B5FA20|nr:hypothetical protein [Curtobacterium sp. MCLR17_054]WIE67093.1 hypothetical protein DEJ08_011195 [Curtobacterium sp. MCLR17_054]